jgi:hypothetical protein
MRDKLKTYTAKEIKHLLDILPFGFEHDGKFIAVDDLLREIQSIQNFIIGKGVMGTIALQQLKHNIEEANK